MSIKTPPVKPSPATSSSLETPKVTGIVLAGGRARRWNGEDKGLITVAGKPMIEHVLDTLVPQCDDIIISANRNLSAYAEYGWPVVQDQLSDFPGPLAGLAAGMQVARNAWVVLTPCDTPLIGKDLVDRLWRALAVQGDKLAAAHDGQRSQPAFALVHRSLLADLQDYLADGERKIEPWFERQRRVYADFSDCPESFINVNSAADRAELEALIKATIAGHASNLTPATQQQPTKASSNDH